MSHREKSLTPWLSSKQIARENLPPTTWDEALERWSDDEPKTDQEKHDFCLRRTGAHATFLPPAMYDRAAELKCDMRWYVKNKPIPLDGVAGVYVVEHKLPSSLQMRAELVRKFDAGERLGASHNIDYTKTEARVIAHGMITGHEYGPSDKPKWPCRGENPISPTGRTRKGNPMPPRKHISEKNCGGDTVCQPGLAGKCVACADDQ